MSTKALKKSMNIPLGTTLRVKRADDSFQTYVFRGSDEHGAIYVDSQDVRHGDIGVYVEIAIKTSSGWEQL